MYDLGFGSMLLECRRMHVRERIARDPVDEDSRV